MCRQDNDHNGVEHLLAGHTGAVNAVKFFPQPVGHDTILISGSVDKTVRLWRSNQGPGILSYQPTVLESHTSSINCLAVVIGSNIFVSGAADAAIKVWRIHIAEETTRVDLLQTLDLQPRFFPLALALSHLPSSGAIVLAAGGTKSIVQIYIAVEEGGLLDFVNQATLTGHDGWVRSLNFASEKENDKSDLLLASASQDKYIRLWRIREGEILPAAGTSVQDATLGRIGKSLSNKAHRFEAAGLRYSLTFEALLLGHEDWIYTAVWKRSGETLQLLSASADNSLAIWGPDTSSGVWICTTRLGEISAQKGSTSATGSAGGFWIGLWSPDGSSVVSLGRTGSWRVWTYDKDQDHWHPAVGISGHVSSVKGVAWSKDGSYLISTSSDQTTRLYAEWRRDTKRSWHEFARPQIHGYDINCIDSITHTQFVSGADEKLLRVFNEPATVAQMLERLCGIANITGDNMPVAASIPVLGLSNKAVEDADNNGHTIDEDVVDLEAPDAAVTNRRSTFNVDCPPREDQLARQTLWPEVEKLYGHGYEISAVAASRDGALVATACRASSFDHAVIRVYETHGWREIKPPLKAHSLTVTCLRFTADDTRLLSVGRDRQWTVFEREKGNDQKYTSKSSNPKGHTRMILSAAWAPPAVGYKFVTAGRDKYVKLWVPRGENFECKTAVLAQAAVTSVDFLPKVIDGSVYLAIGLENGDLSLHSFSTTDQERHQAHPLDHRYVHLTSLSRSDLATDFDRFSSSLSITQLSWQPLSETMSSNKISRAKTDDGEALLAIASEDSSLRVVALRIPR